MALSDIITKITHDADAESARIKKEALKDAEAIAKRAETEAAEVLRVGKEDAERAASKTHGRIIASATHEAKFASQSFRVSLIDKTFAEVEQALTKLSKEEYQSFVTSRAKTLPETSGMVLVSSERAAETIEALKKAGVDTSKTEERSLVGGFILETPTAMYDHSLRTLIAHAKSEHASDVTRTLFGS